MRRGSRPSGGPPSEGVAAAIGTGTVRHARLRPARNAFAYPAFFLRLPLRALQASPRWPWRLLRPSGTALAVVADRDHGDGGPMLPWIERLLHAGGVDDATGEIWLHTMPRVFGYVFNPVSFWFCERRDGRLRAVVCEVNNTFGERHCYLLAHADGRAMRWGEEMVAAKSFHVSPFCRVEGSYRFRFMLAPPRKAGERGRFIARIDHDDRDGALLQTSIAGSLAPLCDRTLAATLLRQPAVTLKVVARIHWQALRLLLKGVPFRSKPAAPAIALTRSERAG